MRRNFVLISEISLCSGGVVFDLHNDYRFDGLTYRPNGDFGLTWSSVSDDLHVLLILFNGVEWLRVESIAARSDVDGNSCLDFVGFLHPDDEGVMDGFLFEDQSSMEHHLIFGFSGGLAIRVYAGSVEMRCI
jgi:hypothetical protein